MIALFRTAAEVQSICRENGWKFCFTGGIALQRWGEPHVTADIDLMIYLGSSSEERVVQMLLQYFPARVKDAFQFAAENHVLLLKSPSEVGIDIAFGSISFEEAMVAQASNFEFLPDLMLLTCSAEDLIVLKAFANRRRDWIDIEGVLVRQQGNLDWKYISEQLRPLVELKEEPGIWERLIQLKASSC